MKMGLRPAIKYEGKVFVGDRTDHHETMAARYGIPAPESARGFSPDGKLFLDRHKAVGWVKYNEPKIFGKLIGLVTPDGMHSEHYAEAKGIIQVESQNDKNKGSKQTAATDQKGESAPPTSAINPQDAKLNEKTAIVFDRGGLYLYCAEKLAEKYKKVMYYLAEADAYPSSQKAKIGDGLRNIERIHDFWTHIDEADIVYFFDCYDGELQHWLRNKGYTVFGSGRGEQVEIDKIRFLELLEELNLPCAETQLCEGLEELQTYLETCKDTVWLKNLHRGDFETRKFKNMDQIEPFINDLKKRLGTAADDVDILVQSKIDSVCEVGYDGFCINGEFTSNCITGYEIKDKGFVGKISKETPKILDDINKAFSSTFKELGYNGNYSTEIRVTKKGEPYYIDATCRVPSPPGELMCEIYENWAEATWLIAHNMVPELKPLGKFGAVIILTSAWHNEHELCVQFPEKIKQFVKLKNHTKDGKSYYCIPNGNGEFFGAVIAWGDTLKEATDKCLEYAEQVEADECEYDSNLFDTCDKQIEAGKKYVGTF
jgi:hypothetical protein